VIHERRLLLRQGRAVFFCKGATEKRRKKRRRTRGVEGGLLPPVGAREGKKIRLYYPLKKKGSLLRSMVKEWAGGDGDARICFLWTLKENSTAVRVKEK